MLCGLPQISSVHCRLTTACRCCPTHATNEFCCRQTFRNRPTQRRVITCIQMNTRALQMGIPGHGCHDSRQESRLWVGEGQHSLCSEISPATAVRCMMSTSRGHIFITIILNWNWIQHYFCSVLCTKHILMSTLTEQNNITTHFIEVIVMLITPHWRHRNVR